MTRREFLKTGVSATYVLGAPNALWSCSNKKSVLEPAPINAHVAAVRGNNLFAMTREALEAVGGIRKIVNEGERVFIKPNFVTLPWAQYNNCFAIGECTKPEIIIAVTEECLKAGASEVSIGDGSQMPSFNWKFATTLDGSTNLVQEAERLSVAYKRKVALACLETDSPEWVEVPSRTRLGKIAISGLVAKADRVISIPVAKTHSWAQLTLALKNFVGVAALLRYGRHYNDGHWDRSGSFDHTSPQAIAQYYLDVVAGIKPDLAIIDFSIGLEGDGPTTELGARTIDMRQRLGSWLLLASTDLLAADATAARIMSHDVASIRQLNMGYAMGLGEINEKSIEIVGEKLDNLRVEWQPARLRKY